jgi:hypothetical protein
MDEESLGYIEPKDYIYQSDEILKELISYYAHTVVGTVRGQQFKLAYDLLNLRTTERLVKETAELVKKTWNLAKWTMVIGISTIVVAVGTLGTFFIVYFSRY